MSSESWRCRIIQELPVTIAKWEALTREYQTRTGSEVFSAVSKLELLKKMFPDEVRRFIKIRTISWTDLTCEQVQAVVFDSVQRTAGDSPAPMDTSSFIDTGKGAMAEELKSPAAQS